MLGPVIEGASIRLEPPRLPYAPIYIRWFADLGITRYLLVQNPPSLRQEEEWLERIAASHEDIVWAIVLPESGELIGGTGLHRINWRHRNAHNGILIGQKGQWGKGYATEAIQLATRYAFRDLGLEKVLTEVFSGNDASRRVMEKNGYRQCGMLRRSRYLDGRWHDEWLGEILREEWDATQENTP